jgi:glycerol-1-phosphate dehydrogenase [NAD(P)+]
VPHLHDELLKRSSLRTCSCGRAHALRVREILLGDGALDEAADRLSRGPARSLWVLSDGNTEAAAGARLKAGVRGRRVAGRVLPARPAPVPTEALVAELAAEVRAAAPELLVAVGSGVLSDLGKAVSHATGIPSWAVATAASVDAYTSATAAIRVGGYHRALPATPSEVVVCDVGVVAAAPRRLLLAGLGDLLAKYLARIDWKLASLVTGEWLCEELSRLSLESARKAIEAAGLLAARPVEAGAPVPGAIAAALLDASLVSGLCMQAAGSSRPAAAAEHTIAHFWEMAGAVGQEEHDLHGLLVGAASRPVLRGYAAWLPRLRGLQVDPAARRAAVEREPALPWEATLPPEMGRFRGILEEVERARAPQRAGLPARLAAWAERREEVLALAGPLLEELGAAVATLERLGFPFAPGLAEPWRTLGVRHVRRLRDRYTAFDLAHDLGDEAALVEAVVAALPAR